MNKLIPKKRSLIISITTACLFVLMYFGCLFLVLNEIKKIEYFYADNESSVAKEKRAEVLKHISEENKKEIEVLRGFFVQKGDEAAFIEKMEEVGRNSGSEFEIFSIDVKPEESNPFKENIDIRINVEGSWQNVLSFISGLEKINFGVLVKNLNLDSSKPGLWSGSMILTVYREK